MSIGSNTILNFLSQLFLTKVQSISRGCITSGGVHSSTIATGKVKRVSLTYSSPSPVGARRLDSGSIYVLHKYKFIDFDKRWVHDGIGAQVLPNSPKTNC